MTSLCDEATPGSRKAISDEAIIGLASRNSVPFQRTDFWLGPEWFSQEYVQWWNEWYAPPAEQWFFFHRGSGRTALEASGETQQDAVRCVRISMIEDCNMSSSNGHGLNRLEGV